MEQVEQDSDFLTQSHRFKATAAELISILEQKKKASGQIKDLLPTVPILKLADIFVATFETCFEELLSMLNCDNLKIRLSKATELVESRLMKHFPRFVGKEGCPGSSVGLVLTSFGGDVQFVVATTMAGKGELHLTSQLGGVVKDSAQIALSWVRARAWDLQLVATDKINIIEGKDILVNFPAGDVWNDVASAGVTLVTALVSLFSGRRVRPDTAMTGGMTLRGHVLPVGGIKDKVLAARHHGIMRVILPGRNLKDLAKMPATAFDGLEVLLAERMEDVLDHAFEGGWSWRHHSTLSQPLL